MHREKQNMLIKLLALVMALALILTGVFSGTFALLLTKTPAFINTFFSGIDPTGDLVISKSVTHPFGGNYVIPGGVSFEFQVSLGAAYAGKQVQTSQGERTADANGVITVTVAPDGAVAVKDILKGTAVTVTETAAPGFTPAGGASQTVNIATGENRIAYSNSYAPGPVSPVNLTVGGTKLLDGRDWQDGDTFTFQLEYKLAGAGQTWQSAGTATVTYDANNTDFNKFSFTDMVKNIPYTAAGTYSFRVSEVSGNIGGVTYDKVVSYFDLQVGDADMNGALEQQGVAGYQNAVASHDAATNSYHVEVTVNNKYAPTGTAAATIHIDKNVTDNANTNPTKAGYTFQLLDSNGNLVATSGATSAAGETAIELTFDAKNAGSTFRYVLKEVNAGQTVNGMTYDATGYPIAVSVVDNLDGTVSALIYDGNQQQIPTGAGSSYPVAFTNVYDPADTTAALSGTKELTGRPLNAGEFTFCLYETDSSFTVASGQAPIRTAVNDLQGLFAFDPISYSAVGTYRYVIKEDSSGQIKGITYDESAYHVIVTVTDENGALKADAVYTDALGAAAQPIFRNTYKAAQTTFDLTGTKVLEGMPLSADMFRFQLYKANVDYVPQGNPLASVSNDAEGKFTFSGITCDRIGTFFYVVKEDTSDAKAGMTYDQTVYHVRVYVWDDGAGKLKKEVTMKTDGGVDVTEIVFRNRYSAPVTPTDPTTPTEPGSSPTDPTQPPSPTPPTGDNTPLGLLVALVVSSIVALTALTVYGIKKKQKNN